MLLIVSILTSGIKKSLNSLITSSVLMFLACWGGFLMACIWVNSLISILLSNSVIKLFILASIGVSVK